MAGFNGDAAKGTYLYSNVKWVDCLDQYRARNTGGSIHSNKELVTKAKRADGATAVAGGPDLKGSQSYPPAFGVPQ
eukprot:14819737-Alexandrium_andersonii.AAC.1